MQATFDSASNTQRSNPNFPSLSAETIVKADASSASSALQILPPNPDKLDKRKSLLSRANVGGRCCFFINLLNKGSGFFLMPAPVAHAPSTASSNATLEGKVINRIS